MIAPSYYCTWAAQNYLFGCGAKTLDATELEGDVGAKHARSYMRADVLFGENGLASLYPAARNKLYFMLDDGWDVPPDGNRDMFGSLIPDAERFPDCGAEPWERMRALDLRAKAAGWAGAALWVSAQEAPRIWDAQSDHSPDAQEAYWRERLEWSARAGIRYWKVDWGIRAADTDFRIQLTEWGHKYAPGLIMEHAVCQGCINDEGPASLPGEPLTINTGRVSPELIRRQAELLERVDMLRTYDVLGHLSVVQTLERIGALLMAVRGRSPKGRALLNSEDECMIAASLGLCAGVMRYPMIGLRPDGDPDVAYPRTDRDIKRRMDEVTRLANWQAIMPAFGVTDEDAHVSDAILTDSWLFRKGETWLATAIGREVAQSAPACISRGMPLPRVYATDGEVPFVTAARHGSSAAVATHGRTHPGQSWLEPRADVAIELDASVTDIGVFGRFGRLRVEGLALEGKKALARDLCGNDWHEVSANNGVLTLSGEMIDRIGLEKATLGDVSCPGLQLNIK